MKLTGSPSAGSSGNGKKLEKGEKTKREKEEEKGEAEKEEGEREEGEWEVEKEEVEKEEVVEVVEEVEREEGEGEMEGWGVPLHQEPLLEASGSSTPPCGKLQRAKNYLLKMELENVYDNSPKAKED